MSKFIVITTVLLLPFVAISAFAQYELPKLELPSDHIIIYELDHTDEVEGTWQRRSFFGKLAIIIILVILGLTLVLGVMALSGEEVLVEPD